MILALRPPRVSSWSSFPVGRNSEVSTAAEEREEAGPCPDKREETTYFSFLKSRKPS